MFQKLKHEIITKFEEKFIEQNRNIYELEEQVSFELQKNCHTNSNNT